MEEIKEKISYKISKILEKLMQPAKTNDINIKELFEEPKSSEMGDFALPCFKLSKPLKKSPKEIADILMQALSNEDLNKYEVDRIESVSGYLNFFIDNFKITERILKEILEKKEKYILTNIGDGKTVCIDYSSPNIAKPFHIGHLRSTVIGSSLCKINKALGYNVIGINYLGDFGTQFGFVIEGYKRWEKKYDLTTNPIKQLVEIYVRISELAKEDESIKDKARENFKKLEEGDKEITKLWKRFRDLSLEEYKKIYDRLDISFDSYNGESYYNDKMKEVIDILINQNILIESNGAKVVMLENQEVPCMILKSNGSTTYATRDLAAILDRSKTYDFTKCLYLTGYEQLLHFNQIFEVAKYIVNNKYVKGLIHVPFGMVLGAGGKKLSTRKGVTSTIEDVIDEVVKKAKDILISKQKTTEDIDEIADIIGIGAIIFNDLKNSRIKDEVFDMDEMLRFEGETGPYVQYTYVRTNSILIKAGFKENMLEHACFNLLKEKTEIELIKKLLKSKEVVVLAGTENEPSIITKYVTELASLFSKYYNEYQIICADSKLQNARLALVYATNIIIKECLNLLGIKCPKNM